MILPSPTLGPVTMTEFVGAIKLSVLGGEAANSMAEMLARVGRQDAQISGSNIQIARDPTFSEGGALYSLPSTVGRIVTNELYPQALIDKANLEREEALQLASASVIAYSWRDELIKSVPRFSREGFMRRANLETRQPRYPQFWSSDCYMKGRQSLATVIHRASAGMALAVVGSDDFDTKQKLPLPIHIAALVDPLEDREVLRELYEVASVTRPSE